MPRRPQVSIRQSEIIVDFIETHRDLVVDRMGGPMGNQACRQAWQNLALKLNNSLGDGVQKTWEQWRRYWIEWKARTRAKAADSRRMMRGTGGGNNRLEPLSSLEERILALIGKVTVKRLPDVRAPLDRTKAHCVNLEMEGVIDSDIPRDIVEDTQIELEKDDTVIQETEPDVTEADVLASEDSEGPASPSLCKSNMDTSEGKKIKVEGVSEQENKMCFPCSEHSKVERDERNDHFSALIKEELMHVLPCMRTRCYLKILNFLNSVKGCHIDQFQLSDSEIN